MMAASFVPFFLIRNPSAEAHETPAIRTDERANPEHDLESLSVQTINHPFGSGKRSGLKSKLP